MGIVMGMVLTMEMVLGMGMAKEIVVTKGNGMLLLFAIKARKGLSFCFSKVSLTIFSQS